MILHQPARLAPGTIHRTIAHLKKLRGRDTTTQDRFFLLGLSALSGLPSTDLLSPDLLPVDFETAGFSLFAFGDVLLDLSPFFLERPPFFPLRLDGVVDPPRLELLGLKLLGYHTCTLTQPHTHTHTYTHTHTPKEHTQTHPPTHRNTKPFEMHSEILGPGNIIVQGYIRLRACHERSQDVVLELRGLPGRV